MRAVIHNVNIRGAEPKVNRNGGEYLLVRYEDEYGRPETIVDKDMERRKSYKRDAYCDLIVDIDVGRKFTTIRVVDVRPGSEYDLG